MRILTDLKEIIDRIDNEVERDFITDMLIQKEEGATLTKKQFAKLDELHQRYFYGSALDRKYRLVK